MHAGKVEAAQQSSPSSLNNGETCCQHGNCRCLQLRRDLAPSRTMTAGAGCRLKHLTGRGRVTVVLQQAQQLVACQVPNAGSMAGTAAILFPVSRMCT